MECSDSTQWVLSTCLAITVTSLGVPAKSEPANPCSDEEAGVKAEPPAAAQPGCSTMLDSARAAACRTVNRALSRSASSRWTCSGSGAATGVSCFARNGTAPSGAAVSPTRRRQLLACSGRLAFHPLQRRFRFARQPSTGRAGRELAQHFPRLRRGDVFQHFNGAGLAQRLAFCADSGELVQQLFEAATCFRRRRFLQRRAQGRLGQVTSAVASPTCVAFVSAKARRRQVVSESGHGNLVVVVPSVPSSSAARQRAVSAKLRRTSGSMNWSSERPPARPSLRCGRPARCPRAAASEGSPPWGGEPAESMTNTSCAGQWNSSRRNSHLQRGRPAVGLCARALAPGRSLEEAQSVSAVCLAGALQLMILW